MQDIIHCERVYTKHHQVNARRHLVHKGANAEHPARERVDAEHHPAR